jgi:hypothetical protein
MWNEEKKLYTIYEWTLPTPVSFRQLGLFALGAIIWMPIMAFIKVPITTPIGFVTWFAIPVLLAIFGNQQIYEGKSMLQFAQSLIGHVLEPKHVLDGKGVSIREEKISDGDTTIDEQHVLNYEVWTKEKLERF